MKKIVTKIFIAFIAGGLIGGISFYLWQKKYVLPVPAIAIEKSPDAISQKEAEEKAIRENIARSNQSEIISYIEKNINRLSDEKPASGGSWNASKLWFIDDKNFYVDYKDIVYNTRRILVFQAIGGKSAVYEVIGRFVPGESGWVLKSGKDIANANPTMFYEKNEQTGEWIIK